MVNPCKNVCKIQYFLIHLDENSKKLFFDPLIYPPYRNFRSAINYTRIFLSTLIPINILLKLSPKLVCMTSLASSGERIQGFAFLTFTNSVSVKGKFETSLGIVISPECRNIGLGNLLVKSLIKKADDYSVIKICLSVVKTNTKAINFYKKHGFKKIGESTETLNNELISSYLMELGLS